MNGALSAGAARPAFFYRYVLLVWLAVTTLLMATSADKIAGVAMGDPDNYMRLVQLRDWLGGQAWGDITQHRMNPPQGGDLHWSRLVDMPIALVVLALRPLVGPSMAEMGALLAIPALLYLSLMVVMGQLLRNLSGRAIALGLLALLPACLLINVQFMPMRIDHHGWQILMAAITLLAWMRGGRWSGVVAGAACAFWMHVSIEGLPYTAMFGGLFALAYVIQGDRRVVAFLATLTGGSLVFLLTTRGPALLVQSHCDAVSAPYAAALALACGAFFVADRALRPASAALRAIPPLTAGLAAIAGIALVAPPCLAGPFVTLDPLTRDYWYLSVSEGLPFWRQSPPFASMLLFAPLPGVIGAILAARAARGRPEAMIMLGLAIASVFAWGLGMLVMRAGAVAQLYALPGMAVALAWLAKSREHFRPRIGWSLSMALAFLLATAMPAYVAGSRLAAADSTGEATAGRNKVPKPTQCVAAISESVIGALGDELLFAPIDVGPLILYHTDLSIVAAGYHRNSAALAKVIGAFTLPPDRARDIVLSTPARHLLLCPDAPEARNYVKRAPGGLAAALVRGQVPDWLEPDERLQEPGARLYRIIR